MDIEKRIDIGFEEDELLFIQNCMVYFLCCHTGDAPNAVKVYEGAKEVANGLGSPTINDMQKRIANALGVKEEDIENLSKEPDKKIVLADSNISKLIM